MILQCGLWHDGVPLALQHENGIGHMFYGTGALPLLLLCKSTLCKGVDGHFAAGTLVGSTVGLSAREDAPYVE
jgi:hypothetical protein